MTGKTKLFSILSAAAGALSVLVIADFVARQAANEDAIPERPLAERVSFSLCGRPPYNNCVIDGDTFYLAGQSIRIADIDTPETNPASCELEARLGAQATRRLHALLNAGPFELRRLPGRDEDQYGRKLRTISRGGRSFGDILVSEGLAREWTGRREPWCG